LFIGDFCPTSRKAPYTTRNDPKLHHNSWDFGLFFRLKSAASKATRDGICRGLDKRSQKPPAHLENLKNQRRGGGKHRNFAPQKAAQFSKRHSIQQPRFRALCLRRDRPAFYPTIVE
jgi:hypothetical protein